MTKYIHHQVDIDGPHRATATILRIFVTYVKDGGDEGSSPEEHQANNNTYRADRQHLLNDLQVTKLVYRLIVTYGKGIMFELALELGNYLLNDGNKECQSVFIGLARSADADGEFFGNLYGVLANTKAWIVTSQYNPLKAALHVAIPGGEFIR